MATQSIDFVAVRETEAGLRREIDWRDVFWVASGVPALVLFSIGGIAATIGKPSWLVWILSVLMGYIQAHTYAEIAGMFPSKSGGASIYGAAAWVRYARIVAPLSVWCNWIAWSPVLAIGTGIAAGYIFNALFPADSAILSWSIQLADLSFLKQGLTLRINATSILGTVLLLIVFAIQHHGILRTAKIQTIVGVAVIIPLLIVGLVPLLTGDVVASNLFPLGPLAKDAQGAPIAGDWTLAGWTLFLGGMFIAAWSTYGFETAVCYTSELKNPQRDTAKGIIYSGLLCIVIFSLVPLSFQGSLGLERMLEPGIYDGSGVAAAMADMVGGGELVRALLVVMLLLALVLSIMTAMAGSSRTLYQGSVDGWLPRYLSHVNEHGAPTRAMWTDLGFNVLLLMMSDYVFVLAVSNCCYLVFNFLNLNAGWIHRIDNAETPRPWRAPSIFLAAGVALSFVNMVFLGAGANVWGPGTLASGLVAMALVIPVFLWRHYVVDRGRFPEDMLRDLHVDARNLDVRRAGILPYLTLAAGISVVLLSNWIFRV
ncbi:APC family permease [Benzoatithermus flavus]|uniref:APC family permease n=1 Tax=Benzoatithermus flavus TaxID=3108223 RepID=A0ABU8XPV6_9PROT